LEWSGIVCDGDKPQKPEFIEIAKQAESDFRDLLSISDDYAVLFTHGGATMQNAMVPLNLASPEGNVDYVNSGHWAKRSIKEAKDTQMLISLPPLKKKILNTFLLKILGNFLIIHLMCITPLMKPLVVCV
jgi:hypothetical protein